MCRDINRQIANTILEQMGGIRLAAMVGVKNITVIESGIQFHFMQGNKGINCVVVKYDYDKDLYIMTFWNLSKDEKVSEYKEVYNDMLVELFECETGLATRL